MKRVSLVLLTWAFAGIGAVGGSILGSGGGRRWLFAGAILGGALATVFAAWLASRLRLIAPQQVRSAAAGGLLGFAVAASLAVLNLHTPVIPVLGTGLTGLGALLGGLYFAGSENLSTQIVSFFARPIVALGFGAFLLCAETCLHFETLLALPASWLSLPIHDWAAGLFLVFAGARSRRDWVGGRPAQAAAWAFNLSLLCAAFFGHLESWSSQLPDEDWIPERVLVSIIGLLVAVALCSLVSTLRLTNPPWRSGQPAPR